MQIVIIHNYSILKLICLLNVKKDILKQICKK